MTGAQIPPDPGWRTLRCAKRTAGVRRPSLPRRGVTGEDAGESPRSEHSESASITMNPVIRTSFHMGDCYDNDLSWPDSIHDLIRKSGDESASGSRVRRDRRSRLGADSIKERIAVTASKNSPPRPGRWVSYHRTASTISAEAGRAVRTLTDRGSRFRSDG